MAHEIGPMAACSPGGSCPCCNATTYYCVDCGEVEVRGREDRCDECDAIYHASEVTDEAVGSDFGSEVAP